MSTENLARLKEEAQMVDMDTLLRYIRVFSDLGSQLRYATQKRVLLEVALIKLCRPAMETRPGRPPGPDPGSGKTAGRRDGDPGCKCAGGPGRRIPGSRPPGTCKRAGGKAQASRGAQ